MIGELENSSIGVTQGVSLISVTADKSVPLL